MRRPPRSPRGVSLIEVMVSMAVLTIGMLGMAQMQVVAVRAKEMSFNMSLASSLSSDLAENVSNWRYNDARLTPSANVTALSDSKISSRLDLPKDETLATSYKFDFAEPPSDANATTAGALGTTYRGARGDVKVAGRWDFRRYWSVYNLDPDGDGVASGKLVVIVTRWKEPGLGMRQVATTVFKANKEVYSL